MKRPAKQLVQADGKSGHGNAPSEVPYRSPAERRAEGKTLRDAVPRAEHSGWNPPKKRRDPVEVVLAQNEGRLLDLVPIRHGRMLQSPFAFYRGTAAIMAAIVVCGPLNAFSVNGGASSGTAESCISPTVPGRRGGAQISGSRAIGWPGSRAACSGPLVPVRTALRRAPSPTLSSREFKP